MCWSVSQCCLTLLACLWHSALSLLAPNEGLNHFWIKDHNEHSTLHGVGTELLVFAQYFLRHGDTEGDKDKIGGKTLQPVRRRQKQNREKTELI